MLKRCFNCLHERRGIYDVPCRECVVARLGKEVTPTHWEPKEDVNNDKSNA
jgi:hypothetical protein